MFVLDNVCRRFAGGGGVGPLSLAIPAGQTVALIGPSGCGKSTILRLLIGLLTPQQGRVTLEGEVIAGNALQRIRHRVGYVIQDGGLFPHLTARRNVCLLARSLGWTQERMARRLDELATLARLPDDLLDRLPGELSGGQRQRVALVRALFLDPAALLLDEPLGALDPLVRVELQDELRDIFRRLGKTVVMVTHDIAEAVHFADRIVLLRDGLVVQDAGPRELWEHPADPFVTRFIQAQRRPLPQYESSSSGLHQREAS